MSNAPEKRPHEMLDRADRLFEKHGILICAIFLVAVAFIPFILGGVRF